MLSLVAYLLLRRDHHDQSHLACRRHQRALIGIGSRAGAEAATISLAWNPNPAGSVSGYRLSWGNASGQYSQTIDVGNATTATIVPPTANRIYYFVVRAYNATGVSNPSTEIAAWYGNDVADAASRENRRFRRRR